MRKKKMCHDGKWMRKNDENKIENLKLIVIQQKKTKSF